jgi:hypothetical protein
LKDNILPDDMTFADRIARLAKRYTLVEGDLYRHGANGVLIRCITREEGCELLAEVHGGECGNHASFRTLVGKAFQHGFYWPTAFQDVVELVKACKACQFHAKLFPRAVRGYRFLYVVIDKFTKWPEATSMVKINKQSAVKFIKSTICRFEVPNRIITDNGS